MPQDLSPKSFHQQMHRGYKRTANFRRARLMFLRELAGSYYDRSAGRIGDKPLNLIFNAIRTIVPTIVMEYPDFHVDSQFVAYRDYGELLGLALGYDTKRKNLTEKYRRAIVDSLFLIGTLKTGLAGTDAALFFDEWEESWDPGTIYTETVDFDDLVIDPGCTDLENAGFLGDRVRVPRRALLESGLYNNALVERVPTANSEHNTTGRAQALSQRGVSMSDVSEFMDEIEVVELWVPSQRAVLTMPWGDDLYFNDYLRVEDYYGPDKATGPYTFLQLGVPVPDNPFNAPPVGAWYDLHILANRLAKKTIDQASRQKTIVGYRRNAADDAQEALDAADGEAIAMDDPDGMKEFNFGGQVNTNETMTAQLSSWFNMLAANPQGVAGQTMDANSATEASILQSNANVGLNDMKDRVYRFVAAEASRRVWYMHTDPLIDVPLIRRKPTPAVSDPATGALIQPASIAEVQVFLTPEARRGDWLDFTFTVQPESMGRIDSQVRLRQALDFAIKVLPAAATAAQTMMMLGIPFSVPRFIIKMAKEAGITWMDEVFFDPEFQVHMANVMMASPQPDGSVGQVAPSEPGAASPAALMQNGQPGNVGMVPSMGRMLRQDQQSGADESQRDQGVRPLA